MASARSKITDEQFVYLLRKQESACAICDRLLIARDALVDHDHVTGRVRGLLCKRCNPGLGFFDDDPQRLLRAAHYLTQARKLRLPAPALPVETTP